MSVEELTAQIIIISTTFFIIRSPLCIYTYILLPVYSRVHNFKNLSDSTNPL